MGIRTGTVTGQVIESNRGSANVRMLNVQLAGSNPETVEFFNVSGEDTAPATGDKVIVFELSDGFKFTMGTKDLIVASALAGEKILYAQAAGAIKTKIHLKADGSIEIETLSQVTVVGDVIADGISLKTHFHQGNLGFPTGTPIQSGGGTTPSSLPTANPSGQIIDGGGKNSSTHTHGGVTSGGSSTGPAQ